MAYDHRGPGEQPGPQPEFPEFPEVSSDDARPTGVPSAGPDASGRPAIHAGRPERPERPERIALPQVRLDDAGEFTVVSSADPAALDFDPFPMPQLPGSAAAWAGRILERIWARHRRCAAAVLMLDVVRENGADPAAGNDGHDGHDGVPQAGVYVGRGWSAALPRQTCGRTAANWSARRSDFPTFPPGAAVAGSFQARVLSRGEELVDVAPPVDGVHLVLLLTPDATEASPREVACVLRANGVSKLVGPGNLIYDDCEAAIDDALPRLTLK
jgi:hypothetical protein